MKNQIEANHRRNRIIKQIVNGGRVYFSALVQFAIGSGLYSGDVASQVTAILRHLEDKGIIKKHGNLFQMVA